MLISKRIALNNSFHAEKLPKGIYHWIRVFQCTAGDGILRAIIFDSQTKPTAITDKLPVALFCVDDYEPAAAISRYFHTPDGNFPVENPYLALHSDGNFTAQVVISVTIGEIVGISQKTNKR